MSLLSKAPKRRFLVFIKTTLSRVYIIAGNVKESFMNRAAHFIHIADSRVLMTKSTAFY